MSRQLALEARHREAGDVFSKLWDFEFPKTLGREPEAEHAAVCNAVGLFDQSYRGVIDLAGEGLGDFLERLLSTHVSSIDERQGQESSILTAKGRLLAAFQLHRVAEDRMRLILSAPSREVVISTLTKYAFLDDIAVEDRSDEIAILAVQGPRADRVVQRFGRAPGEALLERSSATVGSQDVDVVRAGETLEGGVELWVSREDVDDVWSALLSAVEAEGGLAVGWEAAEAHRVEAGSTRWGVDWNEERFPTEVQHDHRLTYDKCYVGQEVVARMRTYGQANRRVFFVTTEDGSALEPGSRVVHDDAEAGTVTSACYSWRRRGPLGIALIKRKYWENAELRIEGGPAVRMSELPKHKGTES